MAEPGIGCLPDGRTVREINGYETRFLYDEIFVTNAYFSHGVTLGPQAVVLDVGANIGLFSLHCLAQAPGVRVLAFEPAPHCFACLEHNLAGNRDSVVLYREAVSDAKGSQRFTFYPGYSLMSGLAADAEQDREVLREAAAQQLGVDRASASGEKMAAMVSDRKLASPVEFECQTTTLSEVIDAQGLTRIDLLKVDVEKAEGAVLRGIEPRHWPLIRQVVLEAHDLGAGEHEAIAQDLQARGFEVYIDRSSHLVACGIYGIYAVRRSDRQPPTGQSQGERA